MLTFGSFCCILNKKMNESTIPDYAVHSDTEIKGFFGPYRFLSNFFPAPINYNGLDYPSSENAFQAQKVSNLDRIQFQTCSAGKSKRLWKEIGSIYTIQEWENIKFNEMKIIVFIKFYKNLELRELLLQTGNKYLEETNNWQDSIWGVNCVTGIGQNHLGKILMKIRDFWK